MSETVIEIQDLQKQYRLGEYTTRTLTTGISRWWAAVRGREDPTRIIGQTAEDSGFWALKGIGASIQKGEAVGIIGRNGSGKSTLLKILARITAPTTGQVILRGKVASMLEIGTGFHPEMTGRENIFLNGAILGMSKDEVNEKIQQIILFSECADFIDTPVKRYSSGMYVKLAFSVAAHLDSDILLMDEVLAVGDMNFQQKCLDKMNSVVQNENRTVVFVSHNMESVHRLCSRCLLLHHGELLFDGPTQQAAALYLGENAQAVVIESRQEVVPEKVLEETALSDTNKIIDDAQCSAGLTFDLDSVARPVAFNYAGRMLELRLDRPSSVFTQGQPIPLWLRWRAVETLVIARLRVIVYNEGQPVGMAISDSLPAMEAGEERTTQFALDFGNIAPGKYRLSLFLSETVFGGLRNHDVVAHALEFEIERSEEFMVTHDWPFPTWGAVIFPEIQVLD